jgi:transcriptional regulator with XRE-family HTH domain
MGVRSRLNLSVEQMSCSTGISYPTYQRLERGYPMQTRTLARMILETCSTDQELLAAARALRADGDRPVVRVKRSAV